MLLSFWRCPILH